MVEAKQLWQCHTNDGDSRTAGKSCRLARPERHARAMTRRWHGASCSSRATRRLERPARGPATVAPRTPATPPGTTIHMMRMPATPASHCCWGTLHEPRLTTTTPRLTASHTRCLARQPSRERAATPSLMPRSAKPPGDADVGRVVRAEAADDAIAREDVTRAPLGGRHASDCTSRVIQSRRGAPRAGALLPSSLSIVAACTFPRSSSNALL